MFTTLRPNNSNESDVVLNDSINNSVPVTISTNPTVAAITAVAGEDESYPAWHLMGEYTGPIESVLPREFRQRLHKHFARIEREFEREYRRLYSENLALQERLEKFEDGDHSETITLVKKLGASMLSQRIKQQYKQSTSRLVSTLRQSAGHSSNAASVVPNSQLSQSFTTGVSGSGITPTTTATGMNNSLNHSTCSNMPPSNSAFHSSAVFTGTFPGHAGSWQLMNRVMAHRDGIWEVTPFRRFVATASADNTAKLWVNDAYLNCLLVYMGHSGSVNSIRFRHRDNLMLTSSGDGTAHLIRLPLDLLIKAASSFVNGSSSAATLEAVSSALSAEVAGTNTIGISINPVSGNISKSMVDSSGLNDSEDIGTNPAGYLEEDSPVRMTTVSPITVRHPHAVFQSANLYLSGMCSASGSVGASGCNSIDSSPLSAADFVSGREQLVTASWDRFGRTYDLATGQELESLTGHDHHLTDVRCASGGATVVVTSSRDCTFRLWDFRQPGMRVHVQQAHSQPVSTTQFLKPGSPERLISAGADRFCRLWDLRQSRGPLVSIRTDVGINRLAISGCGLNLNNLMGDPPADLISPTFFSGASAPMGEGSFSTISSPTTINQVPSNTPVQNTSVPSGALWASSYSKYIALPLDNRTVKLFDLNGNRIGRLTRSSHGHSRMVTSVGWADEGVCNFFSAGFDCRLLAWQIYIANI